MWSNMIKIKSIDLISFENSKLINTKDKGLIYWFGLLMHKFYYRLYIPLYLVVMAILLLCPVVSKYLSVELGYLWCLFCIFVFLFAIFCLLGEQRYRKNQTSHSIS